MAKPTKKPSLKYEGPKEVFETLIDKDDAPVLTSVGYAKVPGTNTFSAFVMKTKGTEVVYINLEEPNLKVISEESSKANFVHHLVDQDTW